MPRKNVKYREEKLARKELPPHNRQCHIGKETMKESGTLTDLFGGLVFHHA